MAFLAPAPVVGLQYQATQVSHRHPRRISALPRAAIQSSSPPPAPKPPPPSRPPPAPPCVVTSHAVVAGGGLSAPLCAAMLARRGVPVTLLERPEDPDASQSSARAYSLFLTSRAMPTVHAQPGLYDLLAASARALLDAHAAVVLSHGQVRCFDYPRSTREPALVLQRRDFVASVAHYVSAVQGVTVLRGATVHDVVPRQDGSFEVHVRSEVGAPKKLHTRLILACDGAASPTVEALRRRGGVGSAYGLDDAEYATPSNDVHLKSVIVDEAIHADLMERVPGERRAIDLGSTVHFMGQRFSGMLPPMSDDVARRLGGRVLVFSGLAGSPIFKARSTAAVRGLVDAAWDGLELSSRISEASLETFVQSAAQKVPSLRRARSIVAYSAFSGEGGVVLFGETAHTLPPELSTEANSGIEDIEALADILDESGEMTSLRDILEEYERRRADETEALMYVSQNGSPYDYGQDPFMANVWRVGATLRMVLAKLFPGLFALPAAMLVRQGVPFSEIKQLNIQTRRRIFVGLALLAVLIFLIVVRPFM